MSLKKVTERTWVLNATSSNFQAGTTFWTEV